TLSDSGRRERERQLRLEAQAEATPLVHAGREGIAAMLADEPQWTFETFQHRAEFGEIPEGETGNRALLERLHLAAVLPHAGTGELAQLMERAVAAGAKGLWRATMINRAIQARIEGGNVADTTRRALTTIQGRMAALVPPELEQARALFAKLRQVRPWI